MTYTAYYIIEDEGKHGDVKKWLVGHTLTEGELALAIIHEANDLLHNGWEITAISETCLTAECLNLSYRLYVQEDRDIEPDYIEEWNIEGKVNTNIDID